MNDPQFLTINNHVFDEEYRPKSMLAALMKMAFKSNIYLDKGKRQGAVQTSLWEANIGILTRHGYVMIRPSMVHIHH